MIRSGLVNIQTAGYDGYPHDVRLRGVTTERPPVDRNDPAMPKKSSYSSPLDYTTVTPSPVSYNDIFSKRTTPDERLYILKQIQTGLDKIQKGIIGKISNIPQAEAPSAKVKTDEIGLQTDEINRPAAGQSIDPNAQPTLMVESEDTSSNFPYVESVQEQITETDGRDDDNMMQEEEIAVDVVINPNTVYLSSVTSKRDLEEYLGQIILDKDPVGYLTKFPSGEDNRPIMKTPEYYEGAAVVQNTISSNGAGPRSRSGGSESKSESGSITESGSSYGKSVKKKYSKKSGKKASNSSRKNPSRKSRK